MARYIEYDKVSGRIISELISDELPETVEGFALLEVDPTAEIDTSIYAIRDGKLVKLYETNEERLEREKIRREHIEQLRKRLLSMEHEVCIAILDDNKAEIKSLQEEFKTMKAYI